MALTQYHIQHILDGYNKENIRYAIDEVSASEWYLGITNNREAFSSEPKWMVFKLVNSGTTVDTFTAGYEFKYIWDNRLSLTYIDPYQMTLTPSNNSIIALNYTVGTVLGSLTTLGGVAPFTYEVVSNDSNIFGISGGNLILNALPPVRDSYYSCTIKTIDSNGVEYFNNESYTYFAKGLEDEFSLKFNGSDESLFTGLFNSIKPVVPNDGTNPISISLWAKLNTTQPSDSGNLLYGISTANQFIPAAGFYRNINKIRIRLSASGNSGATDVKIVESVNNVIVRGTWQHFACTISVVTGEMKLYVNGVETPTTVIQDNRTTFAWGANAAYMGTSRAFSYTSGYLNELAVFNTILSASDITTIYGSGAPGDLSDKSFSSGLRYWWRCGEFMYLGTLFTDPIWLLPSQADTLVIACSNMDEVNNKSTDIP